MPAVARAHRGLGERVDQPVDVGIVRLLVFELDARREDRLEHLLVFLRREVRRPVGILVGGHRRHEKRKPAKRLVDGDRARMLQLQRDAATMRDAPRRQRLASGAMKRSSEIADLPRIARTTRPGDADRAHGDERGTALRARLVVARDALAAGAVLLGEIRAHRRHEDAVAQLKLADAPGGEQVTVGLVMDERQGASAADQSMIE